MKKLFLFCLLPLFLSACDDDDDNGGKGSCVRLSYDNCYSECKSLSEGDDSVLSTCKGYCDQYIGAGETAELSKDDCDGACSEYFDGTGYVNQCKGICSKYTTSCSSGNGGSGSGSGGNGNGGGSSSGWGPSGGDEGGAVGGVGK